MRALLYYNYKIYMKYNKFMVPFIFYLLYQSVYYSRGKEPFVPSILTCAGAAFCIMSWMAFSYCDLQDWRTEQIAYLKTNNENIYWLSKIVFMSIIGLAVALIGVIWPVIVNIRNSGFSINEEITLNNILIGFIILLLASFLGIISGMIVQTKVIGNRNRSLLLLFLVIIVSIVKIPLIKECAAAKVITWILPPINNLTTACMGVKDFSLTMAAGSIIYSIIYIIITVFIYLKLMKKVRF